MTHDSYMTEALSEAQQALGFVWPNPAVGALVVSADGEIVGVGRTSPGVHAEVAALAAAGSKAQGSTLYVTLEPCRHHGRTPPCTEAIVEAGVARVVSTIPDPDPRVDGAGFEFLRGEGVDVQTGVAVAEASEFYGGFGMRIRAGRPRFTLKIAASLDGRTAAADGTSRWITSTESRAEVHRMRAAADAVMVGIGTVLADNPQLTARHPDAGRQPDRVVLDSWGRTPADAAVFADGVPTTVITTDPGEAALEDIARHPQARILVANADAEGHVDLVHAAKLLGEIGYNDVLVEPGSRLTGAMIRSRLADRLVVFLAPKLLGASPHGVADWFAATISDAAELNISQVSKSGPDIRIDARFS